jgi:DNA repair protein SbcD/Mre11
MNIIGFKDVHVAEQSPRSRKDNYYEAILGKLVFAGETAARLQAAAIIDAGDLIHVKNPSRVSHSLVRRLMQTFGNYPCPTYSIFGNHETPFYNLRDARERHPKGVLYEAGTLNHLNETGIVLTEGDLRVRLVGVDFDHAELERETPWFERIHREPEDDFVICVAHTFAGPRGGMLPQGERRWGYSEIEATGKADAYFFGHEHVDQGIETVNGKWFINNGALSRGALTEDELTRDVTLMHLQITKAGITPALIQVPVSPAMDVFDFGTPDDIPTEEETVDFIAKLAMSKPVDIEKLIDEAPHSLQAKIKARHYLSMAEG